MTTHVPPARHRFRVAHRIFDTIRLRRHGSIVVNERVIGAELAFWLRSSDPRMGSRNGFGFLRFGSCRRRRNGRMLPSWNPCGSNGWMWADYLLSGLLVTRH